MTIEEAIQNRERCLAYLEKCPSLTVDSESVEAVRMSLAAYEDTMSIERAQEFAQAEKDGRLVVLPCKIGTDVYISLRRAVVAEFFGYRTERYFQAQFYNNGQYIDVPFEEIGKTVFLTREEAEAALKKREEADNRKPEEAQP